MSIEHISALLHATLSHPENKWDYLELTDMAGRAVPDALMGSRTTLLQADVRLIWARWFTEMFFDPEALYEDAISYAELYFHVLTTVRILFNTDTTAQCGRLSSQIARILHDDVGKRRSRKRERIQLDKRYELIERNNGEPRCWICGYKFERRAIASFLGHPREPINLPMFVDFMKPRGLNARDFNIEVDHVTPFAEGGGEKENLKLTCGWCNRSKREWVSLYDVGSRPEIVKHPKYGRVSVPRAFWSVRLLATKGHCEFREGCERTTLNSELTLSPKHEKGAMNPTNLLVTCYDHASFGSDRFISSHTFSKS